MDIGRISNWITLAYEGLLDETRWQELLRVLAPDLGSHVAQFDVSHRLAGSTVALFVGITRETTDAWEQRHSLNPWVRGAMTLAPGDVACGSELVDPIKIRRTDYFDEIMAPNDLDESIGTVLFRSDTVQAHLSVCRRGYFESDQKRAFKLLAGQMQCAVALHHRISESALRIETYERTMDRLPFGVGLLDRSGRLIHANKWFSRLIAEGDGLRSHLGAIRCARSDDDRALATRIRDAVATSSGQSLNGGGILTVGRAKPRQPIHLLVGPVSRRHENSIFGMLEGQRQPCVFLIAIDPESESDVDHRRLRELYSLTRSEAELVSALVRGHSVAEYADHAGISIGTARWRMKRVLEKTDTHRQGELIARIVKNPAALSQVGDDT